MKPKTVRPHQSPPKPRQLKLLQVFVASIITSIFLSACGGGSSGSGEANATPQIAILGENTAKTISLSWSMPGARENGETLYPYEIGGYEILHKKLDDTLFISKIIPDSQTLSFEIRHLTVGNYEVKISCFDTNEQFSDYQSASISIN